MKRLLDALWRASISFGTVCVLLIFLFLLTLFGTLEQVEDGLYAVQKKYFESWFLVHDLGGVPIPLPGGVLCMGLVAWNLVAGGLVRIRQAGATVGEGGPATAGRPQQEGATLGEGDIGGWDQG